MIKKKKLENYESTKHEWTYGSHMPVVLFSFARGQWAPSGQASETDRKCQHIKNISCGSIRKICTNNESNKLTYQKEINVNNNLKFRTESQKHC
jgi:hypothetical protein